MRIMGRMLSLLLAGLLCVSALPSSPGYAQALTEDELLQIPGSEVLVSDIKQQGAALNPEAPAYGSMEAAPVEGQSFNEALRFTTNVEPSGTYLLQYVIPIQPRVEKDDVMLATFYARTISSTHETAEGKVSLVMERVGTWEKSINETMSIPSQWKRFLVPIKAALLMEANTPQITFRLGYKPQVIEIADVQVVNYKKAVTIDDLPSTPVYYEGMEDDAPWREAANQRIEQIRKGDLQVEVKDRNGQPVQDADVHVQMKKHDFKFGTAVNSTMIFGTDQNAEMYRTKLKENFNSVVMENEMKWPWWEADKARTVKLYNWLGENQFDIRGHALLWDGSTRLPGDIAGILNDKPVLEKRIQDHFHELAGYFSGRLYNWDVLNEPVLNSMIRSVYGEQVMADWFKLAKEADPTAKLYVNETQILGVNAPVIDTFSHLLQTMKDNGAPLDGVGIQAHFGSTPVNPMAFYDQLTHFTQYAPEIAITEFDVNSPREDIQGKFTRDILLAAFSHPNVKSFTMWGFWDGAHWQNNAPLFRNDWTLKPSGEQWRKLIYETWWTDVTGKTNSDGMYQTRGFYGDYEVTVTRNGTSQTVQASLLPNQDNTVSVVWGEPAPEVAKKPFVPLPIPAQNAEITAPVWPYGGTFGVSNASPTSVTVSWPAAHDNQAVDSYMIYQNGALLKQLQANVTSYDVTGLTPGQNYSFYVQALDAQGNRSLASPPLLASAVSGEDRTLPGWKKGSLIDVSTLSQTGASISWPAAVDNDGISGYRIYINGQIAVDTVEPKFDITGLDENKLYTVRIEAKDTEGNLSVGGPIVTFRTFGVEDSTPPAWASSSELNSPEISTTGVKLIWSAAQDARGVTAYRVFQGNGELITLPADARSFTVKDLTPNSQYSFTIEAGDGSGNWSVSGPTLTVKTLVDGDAEAPVWPPSRSLTYSSLSDHSVNLDWTAAADNIGVAGYRVYQNNDVIANVSGDVRSLAVPNLTPGGSYTFRAEAGDAAGNWTANGPSVSVTTFQGVTRKQQVIYPSDDAFIQAPATLGGAGTTNNIDYLRFKNAAGVTPSEQNKNTGNNRRTYLKFPLNTVTGSVYEATLNLYVFAVQTPNLDISMDLYAAGDNWTETAINWANKPADGAKIATTIVRNAGFWKKFTVTDQTIAEHTGDGTITFKLQDDSWLDQNVDIRSKESTGANAIYKPYLSIGTEEVPADTDAPVWNGGTLTVSQVKPHAATLTWSGAQDQYGINRYNVYRNGTLIATVASDVYGYEAEGLDPATAYTFKVEAQDTALESAGGPSASITTPGADQAAPVWPSGAALTAHDPSRTAVTLRWNGAEDQYGVKEYVIYNGNAQVAVVAGNELQYRVAGLTAGSDYGFRVSARDAAGNESSSLSVSAQTLAKDITPPSWSGGSKLEGTQVTTSGLLLSWPHAADDSGVIGYRIDQDGSSVIEAGKGIREYYINGLQDDTAHTFTVRAVDEAGNLSQPLALDAIRTLKQDTITPQWPTGSRLTAAFDAGQAALEWDAAADNLGIKQYLLYRDGVQIAQVEGSKTNYTVPQASPGDAAVYKVEAQDFAGNATVFGPGANDPEIPVPSDTTPPGWPAGSQLKAESITSSSVQLSWNEAIDRVGVKQYRLLQNGQEVTVTSGTVWTAGGLAADTEYEFKVEAADEAGNWSVTGPRLKVKTLAVPGDNGDPDPATPTTPSSPHTSSTPTAPTAPKVDVVSGKVRIAIAKQAIAVSGGKAGAAVDKATLEEAFKQAASQQAGAQKVLIQLDKADGAKGYAVSLPAEYLTGSGSRSIELATPFGSITLPGGMLANNPLAAKEASITVSLTQSALPSGAAVPGKAGAVVDLQVNASGRQLEFDNKSAPVQVRIPFSVSQEQRSHTELLNVWYVSGSGEAKLMPTGQYDSAAGEMVFTTNHFSIYAVSFAKPSFADLTPVPWAQASIEALAAKGIIQGVSDHAFDPAAAISRADFTKLLVETFGFEADFKNGFADVREDDYYYRAVGIAHQLGIVNGQDDSHFAPDARISRQDMFAMMARALAKANKSLPASAESAISAYSDHDQVADYALSAVASMVKAGFVEGSLNKLSPRDNTTRAEASVMLFRLFNHVYK